VKQSKSQLPADVREILRNLEITLNATSRGDVVPARSVQDTALAAWEAARRHALEEAATVPPDKAEIITVQSAVGRRLRELREESGWTQQELAADMLAIGIEWQRETVAEVERGERRRLSWDEMLGLLVLFDLPLSEVVALVGPERIEMNGQLIGPNELRDLIHSGRAGQASSLTRRLAGIAAGAEDWRPGSELDPMQRSDAFIDEHMTADEDRRDQ
jgi:transcriptional regulator with XRE-family HTH domain